MSICRRFASCFLPALCIAVLLLAPSAACAATGANIFLGYSRTGNNTFSGNAGSLNGWDASACIRTGLLLGFEGDVSHYGLGTSSVVPRTTSVLFGPRLTLGTMGIQVFVHALVGGEHSANSSAPRISSGGLAYALGGGIDLPISPFFAWRVEGDRISSTASPANGTPARFSTGLVFRF